MNQSSVKKGLTVKDLVTVGIFSALFLVFALIGGIFFAPNPVLTFYMPVGSACSPPQIRVKGPARPARKRHNATSSRCARAMAGPSQR